MKQILSLILVMIAVAIPVIAQEPSNSSSDRRVSMEVYQTKGTTTTAHRAPMRITIEAWYNTESKSINILYDGEATGEVFLYLNDALIDYSSEINTSFPIPTSGIYRIEIIGETWIAVGSIQL